MSGSSQPTTSARHLRVDDTPPPGSMSTGYRTSMVRLRGFQKTAKGAPAYSRFVNRRLGRHLAAVAYSLGWTPNQVTSLSAVFTFTGIALIALVTPSLPVAVVIALCLVIGYALDSADGQLARLRGGGSAAGEWLDHVVDSIKTGSLHAAVLVCFYRFFDFTTAAPLLVPILFALFASVWFFTMLLTDQLRRAHATATGVPVVPPGTEAPLLRSLLVLPTDYGVLCLIFVTLSFPTVFFTLYLLLLIGNVAFMVAALPKWYREMASFGASKHVANRPEAA